LDQPKEMMGLKDKPGAAIGLPGNCYANGQFVKLSSSPLVQLIPICP